MILLGAVLIVLGFGSMILNPMDLGFLSWAEDAQPALGLIVGLLGVVLVGSGMALKKKHAREADRKPGTGEWAGDGRWAGSSPSAPLTTGPLTGDRANGELNYDVEPTGLGSGPVSGDASGRSAGPMGAVPAAGATGPGQVDGKYRAGVPAEPDVHHPPRSDTDDLIDVHGGQPVVRDTADDDSGDSVARPGTRKSSDPSGGHQEADRPGPHRPDKAQPRPRGASYEDAVDQADPSNPSEQQPQ